MKNINELKRGDEIYVLKYDYDDLYKTMRFSYRVEEISNIYYDAEVISLTSNGAFPFKEYAKLLYTENNFYFTYYGSDLEEAKANFLAAIEQHYQAKIARAKEIIKL